MSSDLVVFSNVVYLDQQLVTVLPDNTPVGHCWLLPCDFALMQDYELDGFTEDLQSEATWIEEDNGFLMLLITDLRNRLAVKLPYEHFRDKAGREYFSESMMLVDKWTGRGGENWINARATELWEQHLNYQKVRQTLLEQLEKRHPWTGKAVMANRDIGHSYDEFDYDEQYIERGEVGVISYIYEDSDVQVNFGGRKVEGVLGVDFTPWAARS